MNTTEVSGNVNHISTALKRKVSSEATQTLNKNSKLIQQYVTKDWKTKQNWRIEDLTNFELKPKPTIIRQPIIVLVNVDQNMKTSQSMQLINWLSSFPIYSKKHTNQ